MATDSSILVFNTEDISKEKVKNLFQRNERVMGDLTEGKEQFERLNISGLEGILQAIEELEDEKRLNLVDFKSSVSVSPHPVMSEVNEFFLGKSTGLFLNEIPEFLEENSEEGRGLWNKLIGNFEGKREIFIGEESFPVNETRGGGFLQGRELEKLNKQLEKLRPRFEQFYSSLDEDKRLKAEGSNVLELVLALSAQGSGSRKDTIVFQYH